MKKRGLSLVLALLMVVSVFSPAFPSFGGILANALMTNSYDVELAFNNLFVFDNWARNELSTTIIPQNGDNPHGKLETNIVAGSVTFTNYSTSYGEIYTAHSGDTENPNNNINYYTIDVEPNTTYNFSYTLENTNFPGFNAFVFYFDKDNKAIPQPGDPATALSSAAVATNLNGDNKWNFTTPADADHIQIRFTVANGAAGQTVTGTVKNIIICEESLLTNENVFNFNEWANNTNSNILASGYALANGTHSIDQTNGSITFTATGGTFTNFILDNCNGYYTMNVNPNTTYAVSYNLFDSTLVGTGVAVAWHKADGTLIEYANLFATNLNGYNNHYIVTPYEAAYMQIAFGAFHSGAEGTGSIGNIKICDAGSVFSLRDWKANGNTSQMETGITGLNADGASNTVTFTTNASGTAHFTKYSAAVANNAGFYVANVEPNTTYTFNYNVSITGAPSGAYFEPWFIEYDAAGNNTLPSYYYSKSGSVFGENQYTLTTGPNSTSILIVFSFHYTWGGTGDATWTISNLALCPVKTFEEITGTPHRDTYTYTYKGDNGSYGTLPEAIAPDGYVFGGWFTGENGTGERITPETKVKMNSFSVFANYEPEVNTLELASAPNKTTYTVGEKLNTAGLSLKATQTTTQIIEVWDDKNGNDEMEDGEISYRNEEVTRTFNINSGVYCTPEYLNTVGTQTITAHYGGKTVTFPVTVLENDTTAIVVNGTVIDNVAVANNKYTLNSSAANFNRYKITYNSDSYVRGIITFENNITEEFFLEPSDNETFVSFIDGFIEGNTHNYIKTIEFTCLDKELGNFQLKAVATDVKEVADDIVYYNNAEYEMGIDIRYGGVVAELYDIDDSVTARVYEDPEHRFYYDDQGNKIDRTLSLVDYANKLDEVQNEKSLVPTGDASNKVNLINTLDRGRYLQQSYYGTSERPYVQGEFNEAPWKYNPVQGGNVGEEPSKVIDYEITDTYVYVKARPLEWEKWSDAHVEECTHTVPITDANGQIRYDKMHAECLYGNDVASDTYVEAWYYFEDGMIKVTNRKVDYSGLPEAYTQQEMPALYLIEPLNHFVYNDVTKEQAWNTKNMQNIEEPEFWGILKEYNDYHYKTGTGENAVVKNDKNGDGWYDLFATCNENWAAFTASEDSDSFGVGIYTPGATNLYYGVMPQVYADKYHEDGSITPTNDENYRHAETANPAPEMPTSYIAPLKEDWFRSYEATEYTYYLTTGTAEEIRGDFGLIGDKEAAAELAKSKVAVPETVYLNPSNNIAGQYYVNNILNQHDFYNVETVAESAQTKMYFGIHVEEAQSFKVNVTNVTSSSNDIILGNSDGTGNREGEAISFDSSLIDSYISNGGFSLRLSNALSPGQTATAKWEITVTMKDGSTKTYTAYTVLYAPGRTVGAVAEARQVDNSQNEISSWITGANGVDHSQRSPLGSFHGDKHNSGYFKADPLYNAVPTTGGSGETSNDYIVAGTDYDNNSYVLQTATNGHDSSRSQSYLGLLTVDGSRYTNTNQIPNLKIGYDALRRGNWVKDSFHTYSNYYTLGTSDAFTSTDLAAVPSGWTEHFYGTNFAESHNIPYRDTVVPSYDVSEIDGKYIHAINRAQAIQDILGVITRRYSTAGTSVLCSVTDKSGLRDAVLNGYAQPENNEEFVEKLQNAATVLGDPSATQDEIDEARKELNENVTSNYYSLKFDNLFSAYEFSQNPVSMIANNGIGTVLYENGNITVISNANREPGEEYTVYNHYNSVDGVYKVDLKPNTEYVFEFEVESTLNSQALLFLYNAVGGAGEIPTNVYVKTNDGEWVSKTESNTWTGTYGVPSGKYAVKFTTGATTTEAGFRFGNKGNEAITSTFSNIKLIESAIYYEGVEYEKTEDVFQEYQPYGTLQTLSRYGYTFNGWKDASGNDVTAATTATEHKTIYSQWIENTYTINYNGNGADEGSADAAHLKFTAQLTLPTSENFRRDYYKFKGWAYTSDANAPVFQPGQTIKVSDISEEYMTSTEVTLYAVWERGYSLYFSPNNGTGEIPPSFKGYTEPHIIPQNTTITRYGYEFLGWSLDPNATKADFVAGNTLTVSQIDSGYIKTDPDDEMEKYVVLHAVWAKIGPQNVTFDNLVDISAWSDSVGNGTIVSETVTDTGFTVKSNEGAGEATCSSAYFPIEAGHNYVVEADIKGDNWDIYIFFCDANGNWVDFNDSGNRLASYGHNQTSDGIHVTSTVFTAPAGAVKAQLRVDANGSNNAVRFENIRAYDTANTTYLETVNKYVEFGEAYGKLPVPVKEGQQFLGWVDEKGNTVTADSIMNSASTVFLKSTWTSNPNTVNDDTVVIEYGLPVVIDVLSNDKANSVSGIGTLGVSDADLGSRANPSSKLTDKANSLTLTNGNVVLNNDGTITYTPTKTNVTAEEVFYYEAVIDGSYYYAKVTVIPATTIYYEDTFFAFENSSVTKNGTTYNYNWEEVGTSVGEVFQNTDRPGAFNFKDDANNAYGYDSAFDSKVAYSGGTAHFVEVDQIAGTKVPKAIFTFTGTGFDLFSVTDDKSGTVTTTIYRGTAIDSSKRVQGIMANTYFGYAYDDTVGDYLPTSNGALFQVPVISARELSYDTYTVVVEPRYNKAFDVAETGKAGVYVDSVRIFDPMGDNTVANEAYKADGEFAPQFLEIRDTLVKAKGDGTFDISDLGQSTSVFLDGGKTSLEDFAKLGPKNEVYLGQNDAVTFHIVTDRPELPSTIQIGMSLTGKGGSSADVKLMNTDYNSWVENITLNSATERYYNIEAVVDWVKQDDGTYKTAAPVIVTNTSSAIISLTSIKWAFNSEDSVATVLDLVTDEMTPRLALAALNRALTPQVTPQQTILNKDTISFAFSGEPYAQGASGVLTITTEQGVSGVTVNGTDVFNCVTNNDGKLDWIFEFDADSAGSMTFEIIARDENGFTSESVYATTNIEGDTEDGDDDSTTPGDDESDDNTGDSGNNNIVTGPESFVTTLLNGIFNIIRQILGLILGGATV